MTRGMLYKLIFIVGVIIFSYMLILPTIGEKKMKVDFFDESTAGDVAVVKNRFSSKDFIIEESGKSLVIISWKLNDAVMNEVKIFKGVKEVSFLKHWAENTLLAKKINLGLDLQGGMYLTMRADFEKMEREKWDAMSAKEKQENKSGGKLTDAEKNDITQQALELIRNRIDKFGVAEPSIRPRGNEVIEIQLPGVKDPLAVKKAIGTTGRVEYRLVDDKYSQLANAWWNKNIKKEKLAEEDISYEVLRNIAKEINLPENLELFVFYDRDKVTTKIHPQYPMVLERKVALAGNDINKAWMGGDEYGGLAVHFTLTADGAAKFADVTAKKNHGRKLAIVIDDKVRSAPGINVQITTGQAMITGNFTTEEVNTLVRIIKEGALPVSLKVAEERTVGPSLGQDSIATGIWAAIVGCGGVVVFMIIYYKLSGLIAGIGLMLNTMFQLALLSWLGFTLTMPGIAGIILNFGMSVDANVLIYERIKEELRNGKSIRMSILYGFDKAFWPIFDSNLTTLIAAFILLQYGTGPVKGFAVTLTIGILSSMFVALYIIRHVFEFISLNKKLKKLSI